MSSSSPTDAMYNINNLQKNPPLAIIKAGENSSHNMKIFISATTLLGPSKDFIPMKDLTHLLLTISGEVPHGEENHSGTIITTSSIPMLTQRQIPSVVI